MKIYIKHFEPQVHFYTGKWTFEERQLSLSLSQESVVYYIQPTTKALKYIQKNIINNQNITGEYSKKENSITYVMDLFKHKMVIKSAIKIDKLIIMSCDNEERIKPVTGIGG